MWIKTNFYVKLHIHIFMCEQFVLALLIEGKRQRKFLFFPVGTFCESLWFFLWLINEESYSWFRTIKFLSVTNWNPSDIFSTWLNFVPHAAHHLHTNCYVARLTHPKTEWIRLIFNFWNQPFDLTDRRWTETTKNKLENTMDSIVGIIAWINISKF